MTTYTWDETKSRALEAFNGETPGATLENTIVQHFAENPVRVNDHITTIEKRIANGANIRSPWAILRTELEQPAAAVNATDVAARGAAIRQAEHWIRHAGGYIDRESELEDELYGDLGKLRHWPDTKPQLLALWRKERPKFQAAEAAELERAHAQAQLRRRLTKASRGAPNPDAQAALVQAEVERARLAYLDSLAPDPDDDA